MTFDNKTNRLLLYNAPANHLIAIAANPDGSLDPTTITCFDAKAFGLQNPQGMAVDPDSGLLFILDVAEPEIVRLEPDAAGDFANAKISRLDLQPTGLVDLRGLAFDPTSGHLHLVSQAGQQLHELSQTGQLVASRDLSAFNLGQPQGLLFAPSADLTDDPSQMHLYLADSGLVENGAGPSSGQIVEMSFSEAGLPAASTVQASLVRTTDTSKWSPPQSRPGRDYLPG
jgi:hypothetical protein